MAPPRVLVLLTVTLCFVVCLCACATGSEDKAKKLASHTQALRNNVSAKLQHDTDLGRDSLRAVTASTVSTGVHTAETGALEKQKEEALLAKQREEGSAAVANINTLLSEADAYIKRTENTRDKIQGIVNEMKKFSALIPNDLYILTLYADSEAYLYTASRNVERAKEAKQSMLETKKIADNALEELKNVTDSWDVNRYTYSINSSVEYIKKKLQEVKNALEAAEIAADNAGYRRQTTVKRLLEKNIITSDPQDAETADPSGTESTNRPVQEAKEPPVNSAKTQANPLQEARELPVKSAKTQVKITNPGKPMMKTSEESQREKVEGSQAKKAEVLNNEKLHQAMQDKRKISVITETESTWTAMNDSSMTVSVSLLFALIVCAAMH